MDGTNRAGESGLPIAWRTIDVVKRKKTNLTTTCLSTVTLLIHDIPEHRYEEALDHMCEYFLADDVLCKCLKMKEDQTAVNDFRELWTYILLQKKSIGAFKLKSNGELGKLVGMNLLYVATDENEKWIIDHATKSTSDGFHNILMLFRNTSAKVDIRRDYGVDKYLAAMGLSVKPNYRGHIIEAQLLEARKGIGRRYGITVTSTIFLDPMAQFQANQAGFKTKLAVRYAEILNKYGFPVFPNVQADELKVMVKSLV